MATLEEMIVKLTADTDELKAQLQVSTRITEKAAKDMQKSISEFADKSSQKTSFFQTAMATMTGFLASAAVQGAFALVKDAAAAVVSELGEGIDAANKQESAMLRLGNAMNATGKWTSNTASEMDAFASSMEITTGVADDLVLSSLAVLSTMTKLDSQGLQQAQKAALDLSVAMGIDLESATRAVGKAINGSSDALKRYGIEVQTGADKTANLSAVMGAIPTGAAEAKMKTFQGALLGVQNAWGNVTEAVATSITSNQVFIAVMNAASGILQKFEQYIKDNAAAIRDDLGAAFISILDAVQSTLNGLGIFFKYMNVGFQTALIPIRNLIDGLQLLKSAATLDWEGVKENASDIADNYGKVGEAIGALNEDNTLQKIAAGVGEIKTQAQTAFDEMKGKAIETAVALEAPKKKIVELTEAQKAHNEIVKSFVTGLAGQATAIDSQYKFLESLQKSTLEQQLIATEGDYAAQNELMLAFFEQKNAAMLAQQQLEQDTLNQARANGLVTETEYQNAVLALNRKAALDQMAASTERMKFEEQKNKERAANFSSTMNTIASLSQSSNKELAAIGKAAAITQATIDGYAAVQKALASAPPPFNFALAGLVGAATAANVAKIAGVGFNKGIDSVPGIGSRDSVPAMLTPGERVVPQKTNQDLTNFLQNQNQGGGKTINLTINMNVAPGTGIDREQAATIVEGIRNYVAAGGLPV